MEKKIMLRSVVILYLALSCFAKPDIDSHNVITVPPNCPPGQELINGVCREVWRANQDVDAVKIAEGPRCAFGEVLFEGRCEQILRTRNVVTVPPNCSPGQELINGVCRDVWRANQDVDAVKIAEGPSCRFGEVLFEGRCLQILRSRNTVTVPPNCKPGQQLINGVCRDIWKALFDFVVFQEDSINPSNAVTVPSNCKPPLEWVNGECREVWLSGASKNEATPMELAQKLINQLKDLLPSEYSAKVRNSEAVDVKNVISVPNQCPQGYKPDAQGVCRVTFD